MTTITRDQIIDFLKDYRALCLQHGICLAAHEADGLLFLDEIVEPAPTDVLMYSFEDNEVGHFFSYSDPLEEKFGFVAIDENGVKA